MSVVKGGTMIVGDDVARFWSKTAPGPSGCIDWIAAKDRDGYGKFVTGRHGHQKHHRPHRWLYERVVASIGARVLMHSCDRPQCVALQHLTPGSQKQNIADAIAKGRALIGEASWRTDLTEAQVIEIRQRYDAGERPIDIARSMGASHAAVGQIGRRKSWRHVK